MKLLLKILKFLLICAVIIAVLGGALWMIFIKKWPLWSGGSLILGAIGLVIGYHVLKKLLIRRRERQFVKQVVEQEKSLDTVSGGTSSEHLASLERQWAESLDILKKSHLCKQGDPLYVLPWYMLLGRSGSGKSSAVRSARLSSPFPEAPRPTGIGTRFCDWWFTEHSIILDTAGKYSTPVMDGNDRDEWQRLLALLLASRKKEPLNGLVVTVEADRLFENSADELEEEGRAIRLRMDELMRVLGAKFPVYILVTKCDQIFGMEQVAENLPDSFFRQPMGVINEDFSRTFTELIDMTLEKICERLKDLRLLLLDQAAGDKTRLMLFPEEIRKLQSGLENFMRGVFRSNPYQESPLMRGIFFSSAQQIGTPVSHYIEQLEYPASPDQAEDVPIKYGAEEEKTPAGYPEILFMDVLPGTRRGLFLFDFFDWVLTADRWLYKPHREAVRRFRITWSLGLIAWLAVLGGLLGLVSTSYMLNRHTLNQFTAEFKEPTRLTGQILNDVFILDRLRTVILKMEESNKRWWVPRFGLSQSNEAVAQLKRNYCSLFKGFMDNEISKHVEANILKVTPETSGIERGAYITNLVGRLQYLNARIKNKDLAYLQSLPRPSGAFLMLIDNRATPEDGNRFQELYLYYTFWQDDITSMLVSKQRLTSWLGKVMIGRSGQYDFSWLIEWINSTESTSKITIANFWQGSGEIASLPVIEPSFTLNGKKQIDDFLTRITQVTAHSSLMEENMKRFRVEYEERYFGAWEQFADDFPRGSEIFASIHEMRIQAAEIGTGKVPSDLFIKRMVSELKPFSGNSLIPGWLKLAIEHEKIVAQTQEQNFLKQASGFSKAADEVTAKGKEMFDGLKSKKITIPDKDAIALKVDTLKAYSEFMTSLRDMAKSTNSGPAATRLATEIFSEVAASAPPSQPADQAASGSSKARQYHKTLDAFKSYEAQMHRPEDNVIFWDIISSPMLFFVDLAAKEATCALQTQWQSQVLAETASANATTLQDLLFGAQGIVWKFVKGPAAPFITGTPQGYQPASVMGRRIAFTPGFMDFISKGTAGRQKIQDNYAIKIKAYPVHINREAHPKPQSVVLTLSCGDASQSINNMNFPVHKTFKWSHKTCGDTTLRIKIGTLNLEKKYPGARGMISFLSDFSDGDRDFTPEDFPEQENGLKEMNVRNIRLKYNFEGHRALLELPEYAPLSAPPVITNCWQRDEHDDNR
jgi:type VI secretion system protein ImpL